MCKLLIVSEDKKDRNFIRQLVETSFVNVQVLPSAKNAYEAIEIAAHFMPEILIIDLDLSTNDGFYIKKEMMKLQPNIKTIILTEHRDFNSVQKAIRCGVLDYLLKPLNLEELKFSIDRSLKSLNQVSLMDSVVQKPTKRTKGRINQMLDYIHTHYNEEINLTTLADYMHLNRHYTSRFFKEAIGVNFIDYLTSYRLETAKKSLRMKDQTITEIATSVGYADPTYFSKSFKKEAGISPYQFRQIYQGDFVPADVRV